MFYTLYILIVKIKYVTIIICDRLLNKGVYLMDLLVKTLNDMQNNIHCMSSENCYKYSDGWRDGYETAVNQVKEIIQKNK